MTGPEHYLAAEGLLEAASTAPDGPALLAAAQVHATLALTVATTTAQGFRISPEWQEATR